MTNLQLSENVNYLPPEKFKEILDYVRQNIKTKKLDKIDIEMIFKIAYHAGLRINEVLKLKKKDFDFSRFEIYLGKTKTKYNDVASFPKSFSVELQDYLLNERSSIGREDLLFYVSRQTAYKWIMEIGKALNITAWITPQSQSGEKTKTHIFRKTIGKDMLYKKAPLNIVMNKMRHSDIGTTSKYLKLNLADVKTWENENL